MWRSWNHWNLRNPVNNWFGGLVVWDLNRGTAKGIQSLSFWGIPGIQTTRTARNKTHTSENWIWCTESLKTSCLYHFGEDFMILSATKKKITIHESQSLSRWTCQQQEDMAITFVSALQWWTPQDYQVQKQVSLKKVCFFWKLLKCIVSYMSSKWVNACFMSSQNSLLLAHVHLKEFILSNTVVFQLDISERARLISVYLFIYINIYIHTYSYMLNT